MKVSDYIVSFFVEKGIKDFFGYQGTMIAYLVDSIGKNPDANNHSCLNEQGAAFAACGYAKATGGCAVAYATSGPGALNLVSGVANAFYDSIPVIFISGQINTYEYRNDIPTLRQDSFQETKTVSICTPITKYAVLITDEKRIRYELEKAYYISNSGRCGPVILDIPMNIQRAEIQPSELLPFTPEESQKRSVDVSGVLHDALVSHVRPVLLIGNGVRRKNVSTLIRFAERMNIPIVTSLLGKEFLPATHRLNFGYLGGSYGHRYANMIVSVKADLIIAVGCSLCTRQTGTKVERFAPQADIIRFDIDPAELQRKIKQTETSYLIDSEEVVFQLQQSADDWEKWKPVSENWTNYCKRYKTFTESFDSILEQREPNRIISEFNKVISKQDIIACDVGQHMMWVAQTIESKPILFSGGHGAMGYALPASIGASIADKDSTVYCFCGDGGMQMNIQELQWLARERLKIVIIILNNHSLGLITQQQDQYFDHLHFGSTDPDYSAPSFCDVAKAYGIAAKCVSEKDEIIPTLNQRDSEKPFVLEILLGPNTKAYPKTVLGEPIYNQEPLLPQDVLKNFLSEEIGE